jgi:translation initiation factor eIF-2B subunit epsilon
LIQSPIISNSDLSKAIETHRKRREVDKNWIMTMMISRGNKYITISLLMFRPHHESCTLMTHPPSSRILHYASTPTLPHQARILSGPSRHAPGYTDLGIDICEADVPALFTENFDWHDMRRDFVQGVLKSELLGKKIAYDLTKEYVGRIRDTRTFDEVSCGLFCYTENRMDIMRRWAFPTVLDAFGTLPYELRAGNIYVAKDNVLLSRFVITPQTDN